MGLSEFPREFYPEPVSWPIKEQLRYVRGFADGEGGPGFYFHKSPVTGKKYPNIRAVVISNTDLKLLRTAERILWSVGIYSKVYLDQKAGEKKAKKDSFILAITRGESLNRYADFIGFTNAEKSLTLDRIVRSYKRFIKRVKFPPQTTVFSRP